MKVFVFILVLFLGSLVGSAQNTGWNQPGIDLQGSAGIEINNMPEVRVFPNPVFDKRVNVELTDQAIQELRITNIAGSVIYTKRFQAPVTKHQIVLENVPSGVYLLRVISDGNLTRTTKLMIRNQ